jgi:lysozyme
MKAIELIKYYEGLYLETYLCPAKVATIGYGTTVYPNGDVVKLGDKITKEEAEVYLQYEIKKIEKQFDMEQYYRYGLNIDQYDACISFIYNLGIGNFSKSTLLKKIKVDPNDPSIEQEFMKWINANGKPLEGLRRRRHSEWVLYSTGVLQF